GDHAGVHGGGRDVLFRPEPGPGRDALLERRGWGGGHLQIQTDSPRAARAGVQLADRAGRRDTPPPAPPLSPGKTPTPPPPPHRTPPPTGLALPATPTQGRVSVPTLSSPLLAVLGLALLAAAFFLIRRP